MSDGSHPSNEATRGRPRAPGVAEPVALAVGFAVPGPLARIAPVHPLRLRPPRMGNRISIRVDCFSGRAKGALGRCMDDLLTEF